MEPTNPIDGSGIKLDEYRRQQRPKIAFLWDIDEGIHWKLYLDGVWKGDFLTLEAAVSHIYTLTGKEIWGDRLNPYYKKKSGATELIERYRNEQETCQILDVPKASDPKKGS